MGNTSALKRVDALPIYSHYKRLNIGVYVVATPGIYEYTKYTVPLIKEWTRRHGYHFFLIEENKLPDLPINFTKIQVALELFKRIPELDYIMHIDADAPIINLDYPIEHVINHYQKNTTHGYFSEDCFNKNDCSKPGKQNSGVFIIKNSIIGKQFLNEWIVSARGKCNKYTNMFPNCQLVLWNCVMPKFKKNIMTLPYNVLNGRDGLLVNHLMQENNSNRNKIAKELHYNLLDHRTGIYS